MAKVIIIGAGAAGLFAAGTAASLGHKVTVIEHMPSPASKLLITGKGRCNLTNNCTVEEFMPNVRRNPRFLYSALSAFPPEQVMRLFETELCVPLKTERGRRVFPISDRAQDIKQALLQYAQNAHIIYGDVKHLIIKSDKINGVCLKSGDTINADNVIVATGGLSYENTGSTGDGYRFATESGHSVTALEPSLVSLVERGNIAKRMMGLSLKNVAITLYEGDKSIYTEQGEMLFTHFGVSGPLILSASAHIRDMQKHKYRIDIDLKPALSREKLDKRIVSDFALLSGKDAANCLVKLLPSKMRDVMADIWGIEPNLKTNQITREQRLRLVELMKAFPIEIKEKGDLAHAVITSGGVNVKEINPKTMESKIVHGLFFVGEVLDVDAYTGGYNLQIAFSTAYAAAKGIE
ncbi:MAG: NAD(P)/FAD-dependent oxidoreductase [Oscillospiraceae bacterium]